MAKKDLEMASEIAGKTVAGIVKDLGLNSQKKEREALEDDDDDDDDDLDDDDADDAATTLDNLEADEIQAAFDAIPANERASTYFLIKRKSLGGAGRGGARRGYVWATIGKFPFIPGDEKWVENTKMKIVSQYGPGEYEGVAHDQDDKPIKKMPKWSWEVTDDEAYNFYGWTDGQEEDVQQQANSYLDPNLPKTPTDDDVQKEIKRAQLMKAKIETAQTKKELDAALGLNEEKKPVGLDPVVAELRAKVEADRVAMEQLKEHIRKSEEDRNREREKSETRRELDDLKDMIKQQATALTNLAQAVSTPKAPASIIPPGFMETLGPVLATFIGAAAQRIANPPPPPKEVDPVQLFTQFQALQPKPQDPLEMVKAFAMCMPKPEPTPQLNLVEVAKALRDLQPQAPQQMSPMDMLKFFQDFNKKDEKDISPLKLLKELKELAPAPQPMNEVLQQMTQMAQIMRSMAPEKGDEEDAIERFARTLGAMRELSQELQPAPEPPRNTLIEAIKAFKEPIQAAGEALSKTGVIGVPGGPGFGPPPFNPGPRPGPGPGPGSRPGPGPLVPSPGVSGDPNILAQPPLPRIVPQPTANPQYVMPVQNPSPQVVTPVAQPQPPATPTPPSAPTVPAVPQASEEGLSPKDYGDFARVLVAAMEQKADPREVYEAVNQGWPEITNMIDSYDSVEEFEKDLTQITNQVGEYRPMVEALIAKLRTPEGESWATEFVLAMKGLGGLNELLEE
jgi:hypothetical protein